VKCHRSQYHGFHVAGTLEQHPTMAKGQFFHSTEVRLLGGIREVISSNLQLYRLEGPANPALHKTPMDLTAIMQPFCQKDWPDNAESIFKEVSRFFGWVAPVALGPAAGTAKDCVIVPSVEGGIWWCMVVCFRAWWCMVVSGGVTVGSADTSASFVSSDEGSTSVRKRGLWCLVVYDVARCAVVLCAGLLQIFCNLTMDPFSSHCTQINPARRKA
jgi:hypothetical protein